MASVFIPIGTNTFQENAISDKNSSREDAALEEGTPRTEQESDESRGQYGELRKFIRQQAPDTTPSQPISAAVRVVEEFKAFCEQKFLVLTANKTSSSVIQQPIEIQHDCPLPTAASQKSK